MPGIRIPESWRIAERQATPEPVYLDRRRVVAGLGLGGVALGGLALGGGRALAAALEEEGGDGAVATTPAVGDRFADRFPAARNDATEDAIRAMRAAWTTDGLVWDGPGYAAAGNTMRPRPALPGRTPICAVRALTPVRSMLRNVI